LALTPRFFLKRWAWFPPPKYIGFKCADDFFTSIDMAATIRPQTLLGADLLMSRPVHAKCNFPRLRMPTKLGYKS
jgi:DMSO/TMAO reductase YedYZ molybdopterin-dependent catalytic subunit